MRKLKVFGGYLHGRGRPQVRTIVAAKSQKEAAVLFGVSIGCVRSCFCETFNKIEVEIAISSPGTIFQASSVDGKDFKKKEVSP